MTLNELLKNLAKQGCYPSVYQRVKGLWRAHVNMAGNFWQDASTPLIALQMAVASWERAGKPVDGQAAIVAAGLHKKET